MKYIIYLVLISTCLSPKNKKMENAETTWKQLNESTWLFDNKPAGAGYTFYVHRTGEKRCLEQVYGSGVYIALEIVYKVELKGDTLLLLNYRYPDRPNEKFVFKNGTLRSADGATELVRSKSLRIYKKNASGKDFIKDIKELENDSLM